MTENNDNVVEFKEATPSKPLEKVELGVQIVQRGGPVQVIVERTHTAATDKRSQSMARSINNFDTFEQAVDALKAIAADLAVLENNPDNYEGTV
jgi:hypothetical protein